MYTIHGNQIDPLNETTFLLGTKWLVAHLNGIQVKAEYQWVDKKGNILTENQPDVPMKIMGFSCIFFP